jgi:acyl-CoA synthetase (NDP forming)
VLPSYANLVNPLDFTTAIWGDGEALNRMLDSALRTEADAAMLVLDYPAEFTGERKECDLLLDLYCKALERHGKTGFVTSAFPNCCRPMPASVCMSRAWRHCRALKTAWQPGAHRQLPA